MLLLMALSRLLYRTEKQEMLKNVLDEIDEIIKKLSNK